MRTNSLSLSIPVHFLLESISTVLIREPIWGGVKRGGGDPPKCEVSSYGELRDKNEYWQYIRRGVPMFLSFSGTNTRSGFVNSLYHFLEGVGICVFINDKELRLGETISGGLLRAIDNSKLYIPIFSKNYASSHWCLRELAKMVENTSKFEGDVKVILPIFYDVKPNDVKLKTPLYSEAISKLEQEKKFSFEDITKWRWALTEVDSIKGWELEKYSGHGDLIKSVVEEVLINLKTRQRDVTRDLVGMEDQIAAISNLLDIDSDGVRFIGIYGMGDIGKTILAKIIFNQLCPQFGRNCSFLDNVREKAKAKGLVTLQKKLLSDISYSKMFREIDRIDDGINMIKKIICNKKMLIVLDDVDEGNQIQNLIGVNSLHPGTRILVTTRDKSVWNIRGFNYRIEDYEMVMLSDEDALKLFSKHAFNCNSPPTNYNTISKDIVPTARGLPLALQAVGSSLFGQENKKIWEERLEKLKKSPHEDVLGKLRISYDALALDQKKIFLDIACCFIDRKKKHGMYWWKDCEIGPEDAIDVLIKRCMIKVVDDRFWMHDQFRDLGRVIAKQEHTRLLSSLLDEEKIICELKSTEINGSIQALGLILSKPSITITLEQIKRFPHVRCLKLGCTNFDFQGCLCHLGKADILCPKYPRCLEPPNTWHLENLVEVQLFGLKFTGQRFWSSPVHGLIEVARKLKVLSLSRITWANECRINLIGTFPENSVLEELSIFECQFFTYADSSIGKLRHLTHLSITFCNYFILLPIQIGELQNLQYLSIRSCARFRELPNSVSQLVSLMKLDVSYTGITRLLDSIGRLPKLSYANVSHTPIVKLPSTMNTFLQLETLDLDACDKIQELPKLPVSLTTLRLRSTSLMTVSSFSHLTNLVELLLSDNSEEATAKSNVIQTRKLRGIRRLSRLRKLHFCLSNVCALTRELGSLSLLKELTLYGPDLQTLEQLPQNLTVLEVKRT